jgi:putative hydrolase of the HAD superfamily
MTMALTTLLLDLDGVLRIWSAENDVRAEQATGLPPGAIRKSAFAADLLLPAIAGRVSDERWRQHVAERLRREHPGADAERAVLLWSESAGEVNEPVRALVQACRRKARVALISNATSRLRRDLDHLGLLQLLDCVINSSEVGAYKPDPRIFSAALDAMGVEARAVFFTDDNAQHVSAAASLGMVGHVFSSPEALGDALRVHGLL